MTAICSKCGRDCKTALALGKHEKKGCDGVVIHEIVLTPGDNNPTDRQVIDEMNSISKKLFYEKYDETPRHHPFKFYDRHQQTGEKCPQCKETWSDFIILSETTWVCVKCGCQFMPKGKLTEINEWRLKHGEKWRSKAEDRICGQTEAPDEVEGVSEDPPPEEAA